jgi:hypothetical protein
MIDSNNNLLINAGDLVLADGNQQQVYMIVSAEPGFFRMTGTATIGAAMVNFLNSRLSTTAVTNVLKNQVRLTQNTFTSIYIDSNYNININV